MLSIFCIPLILKLAMSCMTMMIKEQTIYLSKDYQNQIQFFNRLFNVYA